MHVEVLAEQLCARIPGGTGRYTAGLLRGLAGVMVATDDSLVAVTGRTCPQARALVARTRELGMPGHLLARLWERGLPPRLGGRGVDIVHAPTLLLPGIRPARSDGPATGLVVTVHDVIPWTHPETLTPRGVAFHRRMGARAARAADVIITPTEHVATQVRDILDPRGEVRAIALGVTPLRVPDDAARRLARHGIGDRPYVLFVGTHEPRKGLDTLVRALTHSTLADVDLVVIGATGWGGVDVMNLAGALRIADRVHLLGGVGDDDLAAAYSGAAALALPSRAEGFGIPVIEALSLGTPVVTSDDPALVETSAGFGEIAPIGDADALSEALRVAISGSHDVRARAEAGVRHAATLTWERAARLTLATYRLVASGR